MMRKAVFALILFSYILCPIPTIAEKIYAFPDYKMQILVSDDWIFAARGEDQVISSPESYPDNEYGAIFLKNVIGRFDSERYNNCVAMIEEQVVPEPGILLLYDIYICVRK